MKTLSSCYQRHALYNSAFFTYLLFEKGIKWSAESFGNMKICPFVLNTVLASICVVPSLLKPLESGSKENERIEPFYVETIRFNIEEELLPNLNYKVMLQWLMYYLKVVHTTKSNEIRFCRPPNLEG